MNQRILVTDKVHPLLISGLKEKGFEVVYHPKLSYKEVKQQVRNYQGIIINSKVICDQIFMDYAGHLDFIGRLGSGLDIIDIPYASKSNIEIISSPEGNANAVGEHTLGMLLSLMNNICKSNENVRHLNWNREPNRGTELTGKTIGIIGFGHTGPAFANKLSGFNVNVLVYDKYRTDIEQVFPEFKEVEIDELLSQSDIVSLHLPLTQETNQMANASFFQKMKEGTVLINTSRGKILNSRDLLNAMENGRVGGACLDVLENEFPQSWSEEEQRIYTALIERKDVIVTPHIAGWTHQSLELIARILLEKICKFYEI